MWPVCFQCLVLDVSRSGFYSWLRRVVSPRRERRKFLHQQILSVFLKHRKRAGRRQIHRNLTGDGVSVGLNTVGRIMREHAIRPWYCKPFRRPRRDKDRQNVKPNNLAGQVQIARNNGGKENGPSKFSDSEILN